MASREDSVSAKDEKHLIERFLAAHPLGDLDDLDSWSRSQHKLRSDPELRERVRSSFEGLRRAKTLLSSEGESEPSAESVFRGRIGITEQESRGAAPRRSGGMQEGERIGPFTLLRFIAKGGMGQVWEARDENLRRAVALKLVLPERIDTTSLELFAREARAGGRLAHPNIVATLAYGTDEGLSWIAQELVEGSRTLKESLDELRAADVVPEAYYREVAVLVSQIADGLQAAHDAGVIHRDVKPQNILIAPDDTPKLTDFGLARVHDDSFHSVTGDFMGTWAYMSPEQVTGKRMGLDHRTDVFSLGIVLYELLTLQRPFDGDTTQQIATKIITFDPPQPSKVRSQCPQELAVICGKALEKDPQRRYLTMAEFAADLQRHIANEPILARPPGPAVRLAKWVRRNPALSAAAAVAAAAFVIISALLYRNVQTNRALRVSNSELVAKTDEANRERDMAQAVNDFLNDDLLASVAPSAEAGKGRDVLMRDVLDVASQKIEGRFEEHPEAEVQIRGTIGVTLMELGEYALARPHLERALELRREFLGDEHPDTLVSIGNMGSLLYYEGKLAEAKPYYVECLEGRRRVFGDRHSEILVSLGNLGRVLRYQGLFAEAMICYAEALEIAQELSGDEHPSTLAAMSNMGALLHAQGRYADADVYIRETLEIRRRVLGNEHPDTLSSLSMMGTLLNDKGEFAEAETCYAEALELRRRVKGEAHMETLISMGNMGLVLQHQGRHSEAEAYLAEALEKSRSVLGEEHPQTLVLLNNLAANLESQGQLVRAELLHREGLEVSRRVMGDDHPDTLISCCNLGSLLSSQGNHSEAEVFLDEALAGFRRVLGDEHPNTLSALCSMATFLMSQEKFAEAEPHLIEALRSSRRVLGDEHPNTIALLVNRGVQHMSQERYSEAEQCFREVMKCNRRLLGSDHPRTLTAILSLAHALYSQGRLDQAEVLAREFVELAAESNPDRDSYRFLLEALLAEYAEEEDD